jgi:pimeloyl-ACP methyl ester carboxylesterase
LVIHGDNDGQSSLSRGAALAEHTGGDLVVLEGSAHAPHVRDPVQVNRLLSDFVRRHA